MGLWVTNMGYVPWDIAEKTTFKVIYRSGEEVLWTPEMGIDSTNREMWLLDGSEYDILMYRLTYEEG